MIHIVRIAFLVAVLAITISFALTEEVIASGTQYATLYVLIPAGCAVAVILLDMFWRRKQLQVLSGMFVGLLGGLLVAFILSLIVDMAAGLMPSPPPATHPGDQPLLAKGATPEEKEAFSDRLRKHEADKEAFLTRKSYENRISVIKFLLGAAAIFICVSIVLQTKDDFRFVIPYVEFAKQTKGARPLILDTSVIIDGRVVDICQTRFLDAEMIVPRFVLKELQTIADSEDKLKRNRGRRGLDVLNQLQRNDKVSIRILETKEPPTGEPTEVDTRLVGLAKQMEGRIVTNDYNLNKVAQLRGVEVLNLNDLANALKPVVLPGESLSVRVVKLGAEPGQGVGYLDDGTMVVVEQGRDAIGKDVVILVTSALQTAAGRMIFGRLEADKPFNTRERHT